MNNNDTNYDNIQAVVWTDSSLNLIDQRYLPAKQDYLKLDNVNDIAEAITNMVVRGAPAIGITAAYGVVVAARHRYAQSPTDWKKTIEQDFEVLAASRPTAVNLFWALKQMKSLIDQIDTDPETILLEEARKIHNDDIENNHLMGRFGASLISSNCNVLTHCNTGSLATGGYGTALGVVREGFREGKIKQVYADETRPWLQGTRLTAWELSQDNIPVSLIVEGAAATVMKSGKVAWVIVGSDRIAANGDVANKIGTYSLAVLARHHKVKFMVVAPTSTVDMNTANGDGIVIEDRSANEVLSCGGKRYYEDNDATVSAWNPAFDVTPNSLIDAIVTEKGVVEQPNHQKMSDLMSK